MVCLQQQFRKFTAAAGIAALAGLTYTGPSMAESEPEGAFFGNKAAGKWIIGIKGGKVRNGNDGFKKTNFKGGLIGYEFARPMDFGGKAAIELEFVSGDDGDIESGSSLVPQDVTGLWKPELINLFFVYRTQGIVYFKAKVGAHRSKVTLTLDDLTTKNDEVSLAFGAGLGLKPVDWLRIEAEYSQDTADNDTGVFSLNGLLFF